MKNFFLLAILIFSSSLVSAAGRAPASRSSGEIAFEARAHYGMYFNVNKAFDDKMESYLTGAPNISSPQATGLDFLYQTGELVLGLRFELISFKDSVYAQQGGAYTSIKKIDAELSGARAGLLVGWRAFRWSKGYLGLLTHAAPILSMKYTLDAQNTTTNAKEKFEFSGSKDMTYGAAIEGGFYAHEKLKVGLEAGYTYFISKNFTDASGAELADANGNKISMNFSGFYGKFLVGTTF